ncbi:CAP domain-containing protein [Akkermansiaceae bacterium]|nr:CAP domain-containing protein [Akkermansiaceae bacterium]
MRILLLFFLITNVATAAPRIVSEILARLQTCIVNGNTTEEVVESLEEMESKDLLALLKEYDKTWPKLRDKYLTTFDTEAKAQFSGNTKGDMKKMIKGYRDDFFRICAMGEGPMKKELPKISKPAIEGLRKLLIPTSEEIVSRTGPQTQKMRGMVLTLASFRDSIVDAAVIPDEERAKASILQRENNIVAMLGGLPKDGLRIMLKNNDIARKAKIPADEREGAREVNQWRLLLGLNALVIDPKLCNACRGHSEDMNKHGFFAHESPVPGKRTPGDRAAKEGTGWAGENIYMGNPSPKAANKGWFFSPGHHKNMFRRSHKTIGMGRYEKHWTQMFG